MMRLLVVMAVLMLAVTYTILNEKTDGEATAPEQQYREQTEKVRTLERQLQEQANRQLEQIDASH